MITCNGQRVDIETRCTLSDFIDAHLDSDQGVAVALNGEVVPRSSWPHCALADGDRLDLVIATQGG